MNSFYINEVLIKRPTAFSIERYNVTTMERLANATMVGDLVAKKRKFYFTYDFLSAADLDNILRVIWDAPPLFFTLRYPESGVQKSAVVYVGSIPTELHYAGMTTNWVWRNVKFNLIER